MAWLINREQGASVANMMANMREFVIISVC